MDVNYNVYALNPKLHDRNDFKCRDKSLNEFIQKRANQEAIKHISATYVITLTTEPKSILGFFTLSNNGIDLDNFPEIIRKKLPNYRKIGTVLLGRMARDERKTQKGFGGIILKEAIQISLRSGNFFALEVEAKNDALVDFYKSYGFIQLLDDPSHLFLPRKTMETLAS